MVLRVRLPSRVLEKRTRLRRMKQDGGMRVVISKYAWAGDIKVTKTQMDASSEGYITLRGLTTRNQ